MMRCVRALNDVREEGRKEGEGEGREGTKEGTKEGPSPFFYAPQK
jgi:hypothetical protein